MSALNKLLDKARVMRSIPSDMALAARLDKTRSLVSAWRRGDKLIQDDDVARLAELANESPEAWLVAIRADQATGAARKHWAHLAQQLGIAAAVGAVTLCAMQVSAEGPALLAFAVPVAPGMHIMSILRR